MSAERLLSTLRSDPRHADALVQLFLDDLLDRPVAELVEPDWLADRVVEGFRASVEEPRTRAWIEARIQDALTQLAGTRGTLRDVVPPEVSRSVGQSLRRHYVPNKTVLMALVDHRAVIDLLREVMTHSITDYAQNFKVPGKSALKGSLGSTRLAQWAGAATVAAKMVGSEVERQLEGKVRKYVDGAIRHALELSVDHVCDPNRVDDWADMRGDAWNVLLDVDAKTWHAELVKLGPETLVDEIHVVLKQVAHNEGTRDQIRDALQAGLDQAGQDTVRSFLDESGLEDTWRPHLETLMGDRVRAVVQTDAFGSWLQELVQASEE
jgi:hypothetical protein